MATQPVPLRTTATALLAGLATLLATAAFLALLLTLVVVVPLP